MNEATKSVYIPIPYSCRDAITDALVNSAIECLMAWRDAEISGRTDAYFVEALEAIRTVVELRKA